jgi:hypothetical protein
MEAEDGSAAFDFLFLCLPCVRVSPLLSSLLFSSLLSAFGLLFLFACVSWWKIGKFSLHRIMLKMGLESSRCLSNYIAAFKLLIN